MKKFLAGIVVSCALFSVAAMAENVCETKLFTLKSAPGVSIKEFLDSLAEECDFTIIIKDKQAREKLKEPLDKVVLKDATLYEILDILLKEHGLSYKLEANRLKISYLVTKTFYIDYVTSKRTGEATTDASVDVKAGIGTGQGSVGRDSRDVNLIISKEEFDFWKNLADEIYNVLNRPEDHYKAPKPIVNEKAGLITITATQKQIERVQRYLRLIEDRLHKEVMIDVSIVAVILDDRFTSGIDWSRFNVTLNGTLDQTNNFIPGGPVVQYTYDSVKAINSSTTIINAAFNMAGLLNFLKTQGKVVTLSNPKILTLNNQPAIITIGDTLNYNVPTSITITANSNGLGQKSYTPASVFVGILLNITPEITRDNNIILRINPSISELRNPEQADIQSSSGFREIAPDTREKKISTVVKVKDGSTLILGGLISSTKNFTINGVPILKDIPLLGKLFGSKRRNNQRFELVFIIRPKVVDLEKNKNITLKDLRYHNIKSIRVK
ncbi:MAG: pilus (MSHA type) biogenesis protein MshL [Epsilonproteobacteria bacterium]|nr:pilus (MSHA type) biogenesis protein MshL [Campylobacterota bacterium]